MRAVPGVTRATQSARDLKQVADLLLLAHANDIISAAVDALLYPSFTLGAKGAIAAILAARPPERLYRHRSSTDLS